MRGTYNSSSVTQHAYLGVFVRVIYVAHNNTQTLDHSLSDHVSLIVSEHLLQHGQHQGAADLLLQGQETSASFQCDRPVQLILKAKHVLTGR